MFLASNTKNKHSGIERAIESTNVAYKVATEIFNKFGVPKDHIINNQNFNGQIKKDLNLVEPKMFTDNTGYYEYLKGKYQDLSMEFWIAFEEDIEKYYRMQIFGEGPDEIVDRGLEFLTLIKRYSDYMHSIKPNSRLIVWSGTHYDLISPLIKQVVMNLDKRESLPVDYNAGITITIDKSGRFITSINGILYDLGDINNIHINRNLK